MELLENSKFNFLATFLPIQKSTRSDAAVDLKDKTGAEITTQMKMKISLVFESEDNFENLMKNIGADVSRIDSTARATAAISALGTVLQLTRDITNIVAGVCLYCFLFLIALTE